MRGRMPDDKPTVGITMGDAAGVGPELCLRLLADPDVNAWCQPVVFGDSNLLERVARELPAGTLAARGRGTAAGSGSPGICHVPGLPADRVMPGVESGDCGRAAFAYVRESVDAALAGRVRAVVTAPINKKALALGGIDYPGHTEMFAALTAAGSVCMMMTAADLTVGLATWHTPLARVAAGLSAERIVEVIGLTAAGVGRLMACGLAGRAGGRRPRLAVCGLNPHAGDGGVIGDEDQRLVGPGIERARALGTDCHGPLPADTAFTARVRGQYDAFVCLYHDQGLIPFKMIAFETGVNVTLGLPVVRTSPDHGTAFDIAWQGRASAGSMKQAVRVALALARGRA